MNVALGEPRTTRDLDLVIDPSLDQLNELIGAFDPERFYVEPRCCARRASTPVDVQNIEIATGWKLELVIRKARLFSTPLLRAESAKRAGGEHGRDDRRDGDDDKRNQVG